MALAPDARRKLVGVLGMLGSDQDGERASAALLATRMMKAAGVSWDDLVPGGGPSMPPPRSSSAGGSDLAFAQRHIALLTPWERNFVAGLPGFRTRSPKQAAVLTRIVFDLRARGLG